MAHYCDSNIFTPIGIFFSEVGFVNTVHFVIPLANQSSPNVWCVVSTNVRHVPVQCVVEEVYAFRGYLFSKFVASPSVHAFNPPPHKHDKHCLRLHNIKTLGTWDYTQIQAMEANVSMNARSHKRNKLVFIRHDAQVGVSLLYCIYFIS